MNKSFPIVSLVLTLSSFSALAADTHCHVKQYEMGLRYQQQSAEIMALQLQTYKFAQQQLNENLTQRETNRKSAIIIDLDETVLDNTPLLVKDLKKCRDSFLKLYNPLLFIADATIIIPPHKIKRVTC